MKINANMSALITNKQLLRIENNMSASMERLSSGLKLNHAKDNPAGMAISNKMRAQIAGLDRASQNASDGISAIRIADGALNETSSILQRMRELSVQAANDTNSLADRQAIQKEIDALKEEVTRISTDTEYNEMPILNGSLSARVYAENVDRVNTTDEVKPGIYKMTVEEAAKQAVAAGDANSAIDPSENVVEIGVEGRVSINGYTIDISAEDTQATVYEKLRDAAEIGGAILSVNDTTDALEITSDAYGKSGVVKLEFSNKDLADALGFSNVVKDDESGHCVYGTKDADGKIDVPNGTDAKIVLNTKEDESAFGEDATVSQHDNKITITDKNGFQMTFLVDDKFDKTTDPNATGEIEFEVTDIGTMTLHIGANMDQNMIVSIPDLSAESLYIDEIDVTKMGGADAALMRIDEAIAMVSEARSRLGAYENRLEYSTTSLDAFEENMTNALSRLADTDMAQEMTTYTQQNVLNQAAISVLTQANDMPQQVLQLLQ